jgi:predicted O-methyltransferase YrrM
MPVNRKLRRSQPGAVQADIFRSLKSLAAAITEPYDLIFIDADKTSYPMYLSLILELSPKNSISPRLLRPGGIILADNILRRGLVAEFSAANPFFELQHGEKNWKPDDMAALDSFNKALANNERLDTFLMPMFDGLGMGRLID